MAHVSTIGPTRPADLGNERVGWSELWDYAALGVSLRWRLASNRLRRRGKRTRRLVVLAAVGYAIASAVALGSARLLSDVDAGETLIILVTSMAFGWIFGPILIGGVDETVDPTRLALLPLRAPERYVVQLAAALTGAGPLAATSGLVVGLAIGYTRADLSVLIVPVAALVSVLLMVGSARSVAAVLAIAQRSRTGRDFAVLIAALISGTIFVMAQLARDLGSRGEAIINVMQWMPWAWPAKAIIAARTGDTLVALGWLAASIGLTVAAHAAWIWLSHFLLTNGERTAQSRRRGDRAILNGASTLFGASMSRQWIYMRRSPSSRVGLMFGTIFGVAFALVQIVQQGENSHVAAAFGILLAMFANLGAVTNVLGFDAGSLWIEVLTGGPGRTHMIARQLIALPNLLIPTWLSGIIVGVWTGEWLLVLLVSLLSFTLALNVLAFGTVVSARSPAPLPDMDNPFGNRQGNESRGVRLVGIVFAGLFLTMLATLPTLILAVIGLGEWWVWFVPLAGFLQGLGALGVAAWWVGWFLDGREPDLIERLAPRALN